MKKISLILLLLVLLSTSVFAVDVSINDYDPKPAEAGKFVNVWFKVENDGNQPITESYIEVTPQDNLELTSGEPSRKRVGVILGRSADVIQYRFFVKDNAVEGPNRINVKIEQNGAKIEKDLTIEITDKDFNEVDLSVGDVESDPTRIKPDDDTVKLDVVLQNLGDTTAKGVKAELINLPQGITLSESYSGTSLVGGISEDGHGIATFYVDVAKDVPPQDYTANIKLNYKYKPEEDEDDFLVETIVLPLTIAVRPVPLYEITEVTLDRDVLRAGDKNVILTVGIKNVGEEEGESVRAKIFGKTEQPFDYEIASDFVSPSLKPGEEGQASFELRVKDDAVLKQYFLDLEIKNIVNDDVLTYHEKVPLSVDKPKAQNPFKFVLVVAVIAAGIGAYFYYRGPKNKKKK